MNLISLVVVLIIFGLVWWLLQAYILPHVAEPFKSLIVVVLVLIVILWLLSLIGMVGPIHLPLNFII